jgi:hypothetical protein
MMPRLLQPSDFQSNLNPTRKCLVLIEDTAAGSQLVQELRH